jgi:hypothetical protein
VSQSSEFCRYNLLCFLLNECLLLLLFVSLLTQSGNFWIHPRIGLMNGENEWLVNAVSCTLTSALGPGGGVGVAVALFCYFCPFSLRYISIVNVLIPYFVMFKSSDDSVGIALGYGAGRSRF